MTPENIVLQLKKNGTFDGLRKHMLSEFQSGEAGQQFLKRLNTFMEDTLTDNPTLLEKGSNYFHEFITAELEKAGVYKDIHNDALNTLKEEYYQQRIDEQVRLVIESSKSENGT
ncbi:hypothetical protein BDB01DRAFT_796942 [Pilobolus umbonatus]|nr:hypothetical protein BDB01DRAFT_796942 [Pilobolus umbonatus]